MKLLILPIMTLLITATPYIFSMELNRQLTQIIKNRFETADIKQKTELLNQFNRLFNKGADVNLKDPERKHKTLLHTTTHYGDLALTKLLILAGADVNAQNDELNTPLHNAIRLINLQVAKLLLEHGANPNIKDERGTTPLHLAVDNPELIKLLLSYGADVNAVNQDRETPLDTLISVSWKNTIYDDQTHSLVKTTINEKVIEAIKLLINHGAQFTKQFLRKAIKQAQPELVKLALAKGGYADQEDLDYAKQLFNQGVNQEQYQHIGRILMCYLNIAEPFSKLAKSPEGTFAQLPAEMQTEIARQFAQRC